MSVSPITQNAELLWQPDILGPEFEQHTIELGTDPDGEGDVSATLVRHLAALEDAETAVLYIHGFSDYFFHRELAERLASRGCAVYALDLRKSGRARRAGHTAHYVSDLGLHDVELDHALEIVRRERPGARVVVLAHSTGGLITPLWLARRGARGGVDALVLNSPWLDLQGSALLRTIGTSAIHAVAKLQPHRVMTSAIGGYGQSIHTSTGGAWDFDLALKPLNGFPVTAGWLSAVRWGHRTLHSGLNLPLPILVLRSERSHLEKRYSAGTDTADAVLDVEQIACRAVALGPQVSVVAVPGARHDVFLSDEQARTTSYAILDSWLDHVASGARHGDTIGH